MKFYLGTHMAMWLWEAGDDIPLFVSRRRLERYKRMKRSNSAWALDSGGFTELSTYGKWMISSKDYGAFVERVTHEVGLLDFAAIQDWMCEPFILDKTGKTVIEHQKRTVDSYQELTAMYPKLNWLPVIQGFTEAEYDSCIDLYLKRGIKLDYCGIGSVCRRQGTDEIWNILHRIVTMYKLKLHGFGVKTNGLEKYKNLLTSADSMAWSVEARRSPPLPLCDHSNCANCYDYAKMWHKRITAI